MIAMPVFFLEVKRIGMMDWTRIANSSGYRSTKLGTPRNWRTSGFPRLSRAAHLERARFDSDHLNARARHHESPRRLAVWRGGWLEGKRCPDPLRHLIDCGPQAPSRSARSPQHVLCAWLHQNPRHHRFGVATLPTAWTVVVPGLRFGWNHRCPPQTQKKRDFSANLRGGGQD